MNMFDIYYMCVYLHIYTLYGLSYVVGEIYVYICAYCMCLYCRKGWCWN